MKYPTRSALVLLLLATSLIASTACGGSNAGASATGAAAATATRADSLAGAELTGEEIAKFDDALRERWGGAEEDVFPVRVKFVVAPSRDELSELFLVEMNRDGVGRVDRSTLKAIAGRPDVSRILYVSEGYAEDDHHFDDE